MELVKMRVESMRQSLQEGPGDRETRATGNFGHFESDLPDLSCRFTGTPVKDKLTSFLGSRNPFYHPVTAEKNTVWLFDNTASQSWSRAPWHAEFVAAYFVKNSGVDISRIVADLADKIGVAKTDQIENRISERLQPFTDQIAPAHTVDIDIGGNGAVKRLGPSDSSGVSSQVIRLSGSYKDGDTIQSKAAEIPNATPFTTTFATNTGWAVISDIDDTIKRTMTSSPIGTLQSTFIDDPTPIAGMPELYEYINAKLDNPPFWYLSASPYNLYPFLRGFRDSFYPKGTIILREASWMNLAGFLASLTQGTQAYKVERMKKIHRDFPKRKFLCIGDSTQADPESYGEIYRAHKGWIGAIFIRKVTGVAEIDGSKKNSDERFGKAFEGVPKDVWHVFEDPKELYAKVDEVLKKGTKEVAVGGGE